METSQEPIVLSCQYTLEEMRRAVAYLTGRQRRRPAGVSWTIAGGMLLFAIWMASLNSPGGLLGIVAGGWRSIFGSAAFTVVIAFAVLYGLALWARRRLFTRHAKRSAGLKGTHVFVIRSDGVTLTLPTSRHEYIWPAFERFDETRDAFYLWVSGVAAHTIPKRVFADASQMQRFVELVRANLNHPSAQQAFPAIPAEPVRQP